MKPKPKRYVLLQPHYGIFAGTTVYSCMGCDYGCSSDDTRILGRQHISITLNHDGGYPFYSVPEADLKPIKEEPADTPWDHAAQCATEDGFIPGSAVWWARLRELMPILKEEEPSPLVKRIADGYFDSE